MVAADRITWPPAGSAVSFVTPARASIFELATRACPSARVSTTGRSGTAASRSARVGKRFSGQWVSIHPRPDSGPAPGCASFQALSLACSSTIEGTPSRFKVSSRKPMPMRWAWASTRPGKAAAPLRSMSWAPGAAFAMALLLGIGAGMALPDPAMAGGGGFSLARPPSFSLESLLAEESR